MPIHTLSWLRWIACLVLVLACAHAAAGEPPAEWFKRLQENRPFAAMRALRQLSGQEQIAAQVGVFVGDEAPACTLFGRSVFPENVDYGDALDVIAAQSIDRQVVMLNETHFRTVHRAFLLQVIERLHALGFDALAAETLNRNAPAQLKTGIVDVDTGFYAHDPVLAAALRRAQALGWTFVHYEATGEGERAARESGQARNLAAWVARNPGRRLLVYAGGSHISKVADDGWMAAHFIAETGLDPLTIQQAATACPDAAAAWPVDSVSAQIAFRGAGPVKGMGDADLMVLHPPGAVHEAKAVLGMQTPICVPPVPVDTLLRAFGAADAPLAIARDQALVPAGDDRTLLWLAPGRYRVEREHLDGRQVLGHIRVPASMAAACLSPETG
ncbi:hypothetical protein LDO26_03170 [Luteimonas sp. BDR2-5]|uniref:hypothetical protein n=1 Tax=Proluteimonas luteida TaxID=2878685 RepID=UPI001E424B53|nr:hypothetical protein [Luteimonas sp. BDR2-5]MCD9027215.1 hypothetical protein [Luteimonas sp. BDR2-5]